jgi:hypothetical protein
MVTLVREEIIEHMKRSKIFCKKQFGSISGRSTVLQLLQVLDKWTDILDKGGCVDTIYRDFMKAFDKVPHLRLIHKLEKYEITGQFSGWIRSFLLGRKQRVIVNGEKSEWKDVTSGIQQDQYWDQSYLSCTLTTCQRSPAKEHIHIYLRTTLKHSGVYFNNPNV